VIDRPAKRGLCLILEDNWLIAEGLSAQLVESGFEKIDCHLTCAEALAYLEEIAPQTPDLAMLDVTLGPNETCLPVALELQRRQIPFVIISGHGDAHDLADQLPYVETLQKPVPNAALHAVVDKILGPNANKV
jgi:two-component SAPR family response regulator